MVEEAQVLSLLSGTVALWPAVGQYSERIVGLKEHGSSVNIDSAISGVIRPWLPLLMATVRLQDLHDSQRASGGDQAIPPPEERRGDSNGLWLDIGAHLLEHLHQEDGVTSNGWVEMGKWVTEIQGTYPGVTESDVEFVVKTLSTRTSLSVRRSPDEVSTIKDETCLLEQAKWSRTLRCRLTNSGRKALQLAHAAKHILYARHDADKIVTAIKFGEFTSAFEQAVGLQQLLRGFGLDISRAMEMPGHDPLRNLLEENGQRFNDAIVCVGVAITEAHKQLRTAAVQELIEQAPQNAQDDLEAAIYRLLQTSEALGRKFTGVLAAMQEERKQVVGVVRFDKIAMQMAMNPPDARKLWAAMSQLVPYMPAVTAVVPEYVAARANYRKPAESIDASLTFESVITKQQPSVLERFVAKYRGEIAAALKKGPLSLMDAAANGWIDLDGVDALPELIGVYSAPDLLGSPGQIAITRGTAMRRFETPLYSVMAEDIILVARPEATGVTG